MEIFTNTPGVPGWGRADGRGGSTDFADVSSTQTLTNKSLTSPTITGTPIYPTVAVVGAAAAALGNQTDVNNTKTLVDNTATDIFTVTVLNQIAGAAIQVFVSSTLGDGDSTDSAIYTVGISRIAGAATKATVSTKSVVGLVAGATANAVVTIAATAMTGAISATQTFTLTVKNARSTGAADSHKTMAWASLLCNTSGVSIAAV